MFYSDDDRPAEITPEIRYKIAREHMVCPDCGSDLVLRSMRVIDSSRAAEYMDDHVGLKCTGYDKRIQPPECPFWTFAGERAESVPVYPSLASA